MRFPKTLGGIAGFVLKIGGILGITAPMISAVSSAFSDQKWDQLPGRVVYAYSGYNPQINYYNPAQTATGIGSIAAGIALIFVGKFVSKAVR